MRYKKGHKAVTRKRVVTAASKSIRKHGTNGAAIADIMREAGLTHGGFYAHFKSKEELLRAAVSEALEVGCGRMRRKAAADGFEAMVRQYLADRHMERPEAGCAFATLLPELARSSLRTRAAAAVGLDDYISLFTEHLPDKRLPGRRRRAVAIIGMMIGTLQLARAAPSRRRANQTLADGISGVMAMARDQTV